MFPRVFIALSRYLRIISITNVVARVFSIGDTDVAKKLYTIVISSLMLLYISTGVIMTIENFDNPDERNYFVYFYFIVVTLSTVGYGDIYPVTDAGQLFITGIIIFIIIMIPKQTNELLRLLAMQSVYLRAVYKNDPEIPHIVLTGEVKLPALKNFCEELFHEDHGSQDKHAIILQTKDPESEMEIFLNDPKYEGMLWYLAGNAINSKDLERAWLSACNACILMTNKNSRDAYASDHKNILTGLAMKKFIQDKTGSIDLRLCMQLIKPESKQHYYSSINLVSKEDQLIITEEIKMNLLAKSWFSPGIISLVSNLISSSSEADNQEEVWLREYSEGMEHEIYRIPLSPKMEGKYFKDIVKIIYMKLKAIVFGLELTWNNKTIIRLNPSTFRVSNIIDNRAHVYIICPDQLIAETIEVIDMSKAEKNVYFNSKNKEEHKEEKVLMGYEQLLNEEDEEDEDMLMFYDQYDQRNEKDEEVDISEDYYVLKTQKEQTNVTVSTLENSIEVINHIVVWGIHSAIYHFILPLRARYLKNIQYIVIISDEPIRPEIWESISLFPNILLINGSPLSQETLLKANINYADKAVILGHDSTLEVDVDFKADEMLDSETIFIYKAIKKWNNDLQIMTELFYSSNIEFLLPKSQINFDYNNSTLFAAGEVYISAIIDTLTCQSYYNPHIVTILQQILKGANVPDSEVMIANPDLWQSNLWQISVPEECISKTFEQLFLYFLEKDLICLGLYRLKGTTDNDLPYVYTNPSPDTYVTHKDKVFILGIDVEQEKVQKIIPNITLEPSKVDVYSTYDLFKPVFQTPDERFKSCLFENNTKFKGSLSNRRKIHDDEEIVEEESMSSSRSMSKHSRSQPHRSQSPRSETSRTGMENRTKARRKEDDKIFGINPNKVSGSMATIVRSLQKTTDLFSKEISELESSLETQNRIIKKSVKDLTLEYLESYKHSKNIVQNEEEM